jgi:hypothetical protein
MTIHGDADPQLRATPLSPDDLAGLSRLTAPPWSSRGATGSPPVYSNSAVEQPLREFTKTLRPRTFAFRNRARLNNLLALMRLAYLRVDSVAGYSVDIRAYLDTHKGRPQRTYRESCDAKFDDAGTAQLNSLWSVQAQEAVAEARMQNPLAKLARSR